MTDFQRGIITLMKCAITGQGESLPDGFSLEEAEQFAQKQHILTLVYYGAVVCGFSKTEPAMQRMFRKYIQLMLRSEQQMKEVENIFLAFEANGIDYLPLKGVNVKELYPQPELRYMSDADVLIHSEQYDRIRPILQEMGFTPQPECGHNYPWSKPQLEIELHKQVTSSSSNDFCAHWGTGWQLAEKKSGFQYTFSAENHFIHEFTHFAEHYRSSGIGCRYVLDLWVYRQSYPEMDEQFVEEQLKTMHLLEFYKNIIRTMQVWFEDAQEDEKTAFITQYVFSGGSWGTWDNYALSSAIRVSNADKPCRNLQLLIKKVFPPLTEMQQCYSALRKIPFLLPVFWIWRILDSLLFHRSMLRKARRILEVADEKSVQSRHDALRFVGLDFYNEK